MPRSNARGNGAEPEYAEVGGRLRAVRLAHGLSLRALADRLGVSPSLISQVETGRAKPSVSTLYAMSAELGVSLDDLLFPDAGSAGRPETGSDGRSGPALAPADLPGSRGALPYDAAISPLRRGSRSAPADSAPGQSQDSPALFMAVGPMPAEPLQAADSRKRIRLASGVVWERLTTASVPNADFLYVTYEVGGASTHEHEFQRHAGQEWGYVISGTLGVTIGFDDYVLGPGDSIAFDSMTPHRMHNLGKEPVHGIWFTLGRRGVDMSGADGQPSLAESQPSEHSEA